MAVGHLLDNGGVFLTSDTGDNLIWIADDGTTGPKNPLQRRFQAYYYKVMPPLIFVLLGIDGIRVWL